MYTYRTRHALRETIIERLFQANATIDNPLTENELADACQVSRTPVRDVLNELESEGIVERRKRKGVYLKIPSLSEMLALSDVRSVLEGFAARLAKERITGEDLVALKAIVTAYDTAREAGDLTTARRHDLAFHTKIVALSGNDYLIRIMRNFALLARAFRSNLPDWPRQGPQSSPYRHEVILDVLENGSPDAAEAVLRAHVQHSKQSLLEEALRLKLNQFDT